MPPSKSTSVRRPHTGRRRNDEARRAVLDAALRLLGRPGGVPPIEAIAREAGVGKQTIYRWWGSRASVLMEAMTTYAATEVDVLPTGDVDRDIEAFLVATFRSARRPVVAHALRALMSDAQRDAQVSELMRRFTSARREQLAEILRQDSPGSPKMTVDLVLDQAFGVLWYRLLLHSPALQDIDAVALAQRLVQQLEYRQPG